MRGYNEIEVLFLTNTALLIAYSSCISVFKANNEILIAVKMQNIHSPVGKKLCNRILGKTFLWDK
jgi:hypothetical protein